MPSDFPRHHRSTSPDRAEVLMVVLGFAFWIGWHIVQTRQESAEIESDLAADRSGDETRDAIDRYF